MCKTLITLHINCFNYSSYTIEKRLLHNYSADILIINNVVPPLIDTFFKRYFKVCWFYACFNSVVQHKRCANMTEIFYLLFGILYTAKVCIYKCELIKINHILSLAYLKCETSGRNLFNKWNIQTNMYLHRSSIEIPAYACKVNKYSFYLNTRQNERF